MVRRNGSKWHSSQGQVTMRKMSNIICNKIKVTHWQNVISVTLFFSFLFLKQINTCFKNLPICSANTQ